MISGAVRTLLAVAAMLCLAAVAPQRGAAAEPSQSATGSEPAIGIAERLGTRIPLDVTFRDETGAPVRLADLITGPTIILPVYYSCANVCYNLQQNLAAVLPTIKSRPDADYRVISFSFDERETPELAAKFKRVYLGALGSSFPATGWRFLTGNAESIRALTDAVGYGFQRRGRDFLHPAASLVVAGDGTIVRYLYGTRFLAKDLALALVEARNGTAGITIRKMVEYCFTFDPTRQTYVFNLLRVSATVVILCTGAFMAFLFLGGRKPRQKPSEKQ